eukprot:scaffold389_cov382-Prasinococcus_capsulatus_cf.AAC.16
MPPAPLRLVRVVPRRTDTNGASPLPSLPLSDRPLRAFLGSPRLQPARDARIAERKAPRKPSSRDMV